ncbi:MAG: universal stress protein [Alphaproteobacteria bacterium]|nr:MAG: universal stress protein [Alphaproteobacteria bacterium]
MMTTPFVDVDVRPTLRAGGEPFGEIMRAVAALRPGQGLRLLATFKPVPLFNVLGAKGFSHEAREIGGGDWEVLFRPTAAAAEPAGPAHPTAANDDEWPDPVRHLDNRDLDPPEPMVRILAATEDMKEGEVLSALLCREPMFLIPELEKRHHRWTGGFEPDGKTYRIVVRIGTHGDATA